MSASDENPAAQGPGPADGPPPTEAVVPGRPVPDEPARRSAADEPEPPVVGSAVVRRVPRYRGFVTAGAVLGAVVAVLVVLLGPAGPEGGVGRGPVLVFLVLIGTLVCALLGALVAVLLERARR